ncbi:MAG: diguanylate cyclase (GGDEF)-like protein [Myxococcota bacterium]
MLDSQHQTRDVQDRVLLLEDDPADLALLSTYLNGRWQVEGANSLQTALARLTQRSYDVLVVGLMLPDATPLDAVRQLRMQAPDLPIVALTGYDDPRVEMGITQCGAEIVLPKNVLSPSTLDEALRTAHRAKRDERRSMYLAAADPLTGLANERRFLEALTTSLAIDRIPLAVARIDVDELRTINARYGESVGDAILQEIAWRLGGLARRTDIVARLGADDFVILLSGICEAEALHNIGRRVLDQLAGPFFAPGVAHSIPLAASIGFALSDGRGESVEAVLVAAEAALAESKASESPDVCVHPTEVRRVQASTKALANALARDEFVLAYQPQYCFKAEAVVGFEALIRWQPEVGPMVMPSAFIPQLESSNLIVEVGRWVLDTACSQLSRVRATTGQIPQLAVNVSARQFQQPDFVQTVIDILDRYTIAPQHLELEITETVVMQDCAHTRRVLTQLRAHGVKIALDDFGTGYSALSYLNRFPIDVLKLDRSLVSSVREVGCGAMIASAIIQLAHNLGMTVVGEGVETDEEADFLRTEGCDIVQGYLIGRPSLTSMLDTHDAWTH